MLQFGSHTDDKKTAGDWLFPSQFLGFSGHQNGYLRLC